MILPYQIAKDCGWFRLWNRGPGLMWRHRSYDPPFSERYGYQRFWPAHPKGAWRIGLLRAYPK